jgi:hypothetical protein
MRSKNLVILFMVFGVLAGCKKNVDKPRDESEHEAINSVTITFRSGASTLSFTAEDPDGDGGNPPTRMDVIRLNANTTYTAELTLRNISGTTTRDITGNIQAQGQHHELFYLPAGVPVTVAKMDKDKNSLPLGFSTTWTTTATGTGSVLIKLMHKPFIKSANDSHTIGHSDLALTMPLIIQ